MSRPLPKWLAVVLTALYLPAMAAIGMVLHTDLFWSVVKWAVYAIGTVIVVAILVALHWGLYRWFRGEKPVADPLPVDFMPPGG